MTKRKYHSDDYIVSKKEAVQALKDGGGVRGAAKIVGCSYGTMITICEYLEVKLPGRGRRRVIIPKEKLEPFTEGFTWQHIADIFNCSIGAIRKEFKRHRLTKKDERSKGEDFKCVL